MLSDSATIRSVNRRTVAVLAVDSGYAGKLVTWATGKLKPKLTLEIVKRPDDLHTFQVLPCRWVVGRTLAWITRCRRTVRDCERLPADHETIVHWAINHRHDPAPRPPATRRSSRALPSSGQALRISL